MVCAVNDSEIKTLKDGIKLIADLCEIIDEAGACNKCPMKKICVSCTSFKDIAEGLTKDMLNEMGAFVDDIETICDPLGEYYEREYRAYADEREIGV